MEPSQNSMGTSVNNFPSNPTNTLMPKSVKPKKTEIRYIFFGIVAALLIGGATLAYILSQKGSGEIIRPFPDKDSKAQVDTTKGEMAENPLNGKLSPLKFSDESVDLRPLAVMVNNHVDARPQSGLNHADLVYEIVAEGGITRFLAFFLSDTPEKIGPVRSTREYYLVLVKELGDAMLMHIGWSPQALEAIETWPVRSLGRGGGTFWRDTTLDVATEHTAYTNGVELRTIAEDLGWNGRREFDTWKFKDDKKGYGDAPAANTIAIDFWDKGDYSAYWKYDAGTNSYLRFTGYDVSDQPISHMDRETQQQLKFKNVVVQFAPEVAIYGDDKGRNDYELVGSGDGLIFEDGKVIKATWSKASRDERTKFYDLNGKEIEYNRGEIWISIVPDRNIDQVIYQ